MIYSYYPGCTLKDRAKQLDIYARASAQALGIELLFILSAVLGLCNSAYAATIKTKKISNV